MNSESETKWDKIYANKAELSTPQATALVQQHQHFLPKQGVALDYACGRGGNALCFSRAGLQTLALDISSVVLKQLTAHARAEDLNIETSAQDLSAYSLSPDSFDVVACSFYLDREKFRELSDALKPSGLLFYETFNGGLPTGQGPSNPDFLLARGELLARYAKLNVLYYQELWGFADIDGNTGVSRLVAQKPRQQSV